MYLQFAGLRSFSLSLFDNLDYIQREKVKRYNKAQIVASCFCLTQKKSNYTSANKSRPVNFTCCFQVCAQNEIILSNYWVNYEFKCYMINMGYKITYIYKVTVWNLLVCHKNMLKLKDMI